MSENQYRELFKTLGIEAREIGHVLRYAGKPRRVYFNRNRHIGIYFSAHSDDEAWYPVSLWNRIDTYRVKKKRITAGLMLFPHLEWKLGRFGTSFPTGKGIPLGSIACNLLLSDDGAYSFNSATILRRICSSSAPITSMPKTTSLSRPS